MLSAPDPADVLSVSALTQRIRAKIEGTFPSVWVSGEISNVSKAGSGHIYFSLKDEDAIIGAALFRGVGLRVRFDVRDGMEVLINGKVTVYPPQGKYQLQVQQIIPKGIGALELAFQQLRDKLQAKGYFDPRRKRPLPKYPRTIALVTSPTGAAIRDMLELLARRWPCAKVLVVPVRVQGDGAAEEIAEAIRALNRLQAASRLSVDAMIVGRGGGSLEDLWAFNEEVVAEAVFKSKIVVISAVGHEIDVSISDLVADHRALTPSHAITDLTPDCEALRTALGDLNRQLSQRLSRRLDLWRQRVAGFADRPVFRNPLDRIRDLEKRLDDQEQRLRRASQVATERAGNRVAMLAGRLQSLSPLNVLARGYSLTLFNNGQLIRDAGEVEVGDRVTTRLSQGSITSRVESVEPPTEN
jgi:exodeoxyribonuclease VII large subunit